MKKALHTHCLAVSNKKVDALEQELNAMRQAVQTESKSTAGDKHETGRAMIHLEQEKLHQQLAEAKGLAAELALMNPKIQLQTVQKGALVKTNRATFYVAVGLGKLQLKSESVFVVSAHAPIAKKMLGKHAGELFDVNGIAYKITSIC